MAAFVTDTDLLLLTYIKMMLGSTGVLPLANDTDWGYDDENKKNEY